MAFTAARWSLYCCTGRRLELFHTNNCTEEHDEDSQDYAWIRFLLLSEIILASFKMLP